MPLQNVKTKQKLRIINALDNAKREALVSKVAHCLPAEKVTEQRESIALSHGYTTFIRCDNGHEFRSKEVTYWAARRRVTLSFMESEKPLQNCLIKAFTGIMRDKCLKLYFLHSVQDAQQIIDAFRRDYNHNVPHGSLGDSQQH